MLEIVGVAKQFRGTVALEGVDLTAPAGCFLALLGPSGSGKTTLLRIIAGLDFADQGSVRLDGQDLTEVPARHRRFGMVFQNYALFRHMTVARNVAFGLEVRPRRERPARAEIAARVEALLARMQLAGLGGRYPAQLSGGQRQRVALARALAIEPRLLLLDEPFGALDAQVRRDLRRWLRQLHDETGLLTVFVTHDQEEALDLADLVAVMNKGRIEQLGAPLEVYRNPATPFVTGFLGNTNRLSAQVREGTVLLAAGAAEGDLRAWGPAPPLAKDGPTVLYVRPADLALRPAGAGIPARVHAVLAAGPQVRVEVATALADAPLELLLPPSLPAPTPGEHLAVWPEAGRVFV